MATTATDTKTDTRSSTQPKRPWLWNVVLLNDDDHTYDYVIRMMQEVFAHSIERAYAIATVVDSQDRAIVLTTHKEHAELKRDQILAFGKDPIMAVCKGSMSAIIEPAEFDSDESSGASSGSGKDRKPEGEPGKPGKP